MVLFLPCCFARTPAWLLEQEFTLAGLSNKVVLSQPCQPGPLLLPCPENTSDIALCAADFKGQPHLSWFHLKMWHPYIYSSDEKRLSPGHCQVVSWKEIYTIYIQTCWSKKSALPLTVWGSPNLIIFTLGFKEVAQEGTVAHVLFPQRLKFEVSEAEFHVGW